MTLSGGLIAAVALVYMAILFAIAFYGDRNSASMSPRLRPWVYSLSLAVYCTSWTFFGAVGQAAGELWSFLPIYLGPMIVLLFAPWVLEKMVAISKQENITSIADFIAARYGKSQLLAVVVTLICLVGVLPYIALQLKGIVLGVNVLSGINIEAAGTGTRDTALIVSIVLALFTILFGTRNLDVTEHHRGMVLAIAFESLVKLGAFLAVGVAGQNDATTVARRQIDRLFRVLQGVALAKAMAEHHDQAAQLGAGTDQHVPDIFEHSHLSYEEIYKLLHSVMLR